MTCKDIRLPELLAPAGSLSHLKAALNAGADAVYIGGEKFGARAYAGNFSGQDIAEGLSYAHFYDKKVYLTVNTLMKEEEISDELYSFLSPFVKAGLHGVIVQDTGTASFIRRTFPELPVHASTQMTITNPYGARFAAKAGMTRVVPARELSIAEIEEIKKQSGLEVEVFIHGALCVCYSGQCLMSAMQGGRSGNRGQCAQPCRLPYAAYEKGRKISDEEKRYLLSPRDLCGLSYLPRLCEIGVDSLKIEGRMKNPVYVAGVTSIYRKYLDHLEEYTGQDGLLHPEEEDRNNLEELYCRTSFTDGYFDRHNGSVMMSLKSPKNTGHLLGHVREVRPGQISADFKEMISPGDLLVIRKKDGEEAILTVPKSIDQEFDKKKRTRRIVLKTADYRQIAPDSPIYRRRKEKLVQEIEEKYLKGEKKRRADLMVTLEKDRPALVRAVSGRHAVTLQGQVLSASMKRPLTREDIEKEFRKTGNVSFDTGKLEIRLGDSLFMPLSAIKSLRRETFCRLDAVCRQAEHVYDGEEKEIAALDTLNEVRTGFHLTVYNETQLKLCLSKPEITAISLPRDVFSERELNDYGQKIKDSGKESILILERVMRNTDREKDRKLLSGHFQTVMVHNINQLEYIFSEYPDLQVIAGPSLYQWNDQSRILLAGMYGCLAGMEAPMEFSAKELASWPKVIYNASDSQVSQDLLIYGRFPLMITASCIRASLDRCNHRSEQLTLSGDRGNRYPVTTHCRWCYNTIWSQDPERFSLKEVRELSGSYHRFRIDLFGLEPDEAEDVLRHYL